MSLAHQHLRRCLAGDLIHGRRASWPHAMALMHAVAAAPGPESEAVLREVALYDGTLQLDTSAGLPHALSPEDTLRCLAVQVLAAWDPKRHRAVIRAVHRASGNDVVRTIAEARMQ
jgi:hypothetical protein